MKSYFRPFRHAVRKRIRAYRGIYSQFDTILLYLLKTNLQNTNTAPVIFDVGAHYGESIERFRNLFTESIIHSFEADADNYKILKKNWGNKGDITLNNLGVSRAKGALLFHRNIKHNTSGFHAVNMESEWVKNRSARFDVSPDQFTEKSYEVPIIDLDSYVKEFEIPHIHLLKIDTQGHEDEVLAGCEDTLKKGMIDVIETELIVGNPYIKSLQFYDIEKTLIPLGFRFYGIDKGGDLLQKPSLGFNVIYVHERVLA
jgi:FkbM family methyltransferase